MHKVCSIHPIILAIQQILESHDLKGASATFDHAYPIIICYSEIVSPCKKSVCFIDSFMRYSQFKSPVTRVATPISDHTHPNIFLSTLNFWYQYAKKQAISSLCSRDIFDLKILQSDWHRLVWPILTEKQTNRFTAFTYA